MLKKSFGLALAAVVMIASAAQAKIVDIKAVAGKTPAEVAKVLGKPSKIEKIKPSGTGCNPCDKAYYKGDKFEIVFIKGRADWITVNELSNLLWRKESLSEFGLPVKSPTDIGAGLIWTNIPGYVKVQLFNDGPHADYLYIKVKTK